jgi:protoporphyrin/coproporphyrin ferrochelatase
MSTLKGIQNFQHGRKPKIGVLLCNLGTPTEPTTRAVRKYLAEFLSDKRVVELSKLLWLPILHGIILNTRPRKSAKAYKSIWTNEGSPLLVFSKKIKNKLQHKYDTKNDNSVIFELGMRYGEPSIQIALENLVKKNVRKILILPLYPQYASATTASVYDAIFDYCKTLRWVPELRFASDYHDDTLYIGGVANSIRKQWQDRGKGQHLLFSFHGIPKENFLAGDPYHCQCYATARLIAEELGLADSDWRLTFQSRFGPKQWLEPYTDKTLINLGTQGVKNVDIVCPGFSVDCLETLEEIAILNQDVFRKHGGEEVKYIPALNDSAEQINLLSSLVEGHLSNWSQSSDETFLTLAAARAFEAGADR